MSIIAETRNIILRDGGSLVFNLLTSIILARSLGPEKLGIWFIYLTIFASLDAIFRLKSEVSSVYFLASKKITFRNLERGLLLITFGTIGLLLIIMFIFGDYAYRYFYHDFGNEYKLQFYSISVTLGLSFIATFYFYLALGLENYKIYNLIILTQSFVNFIIVFTFMCVFTPSVWAAIIAINFSWFVAMSIGVYYFHFNQKKAHNNDRSKSFGAIGTLIKSGLPIYLASLIKTFQDQLPRYFLISIFSISYLAYVATAQLIMNVIIRFCTAICAVLYPRLSSLSDDSQLNLLYTAVRITLIINALLFLVLYYLINVLVLLVYGESYSEVATYIKILLPSLYFLVPARLMEQLISSRGDFGLRILISIASCLSMVMIIFYFHSRLTLDVIIVSIAISNFVQSIVVFVIMKYRYEVQFRAFVPTKSDFVNILEFFKVMK